jgi:hypothetical protein
MPGNVTACAMSLPKTLQRTVLSRATPLDIMTKLLTEGGTYVYPQEGGS